MKKHVWPARVLVKYALLQIPDLALLISVLIIIQRWIDLPSWLIWGLILLWVAKDVILFPFLWRAYDSNRSGEKRLMIGKQGIVEEQLSPSGYVRIHGELWQAEVKGKRTSIDKGEIIRVKDINGLKLLVQPVIEENQENES